MIRALAILGLLSAAGCAERPEVVADPVATAPAVASEVIAPAAVQRRAWWPLRGRVATLASAEETPTLLWAHRPEGERWTEATLAALRSHGAALPASEPANIEAWCPAYEEAPQQDREAFWAALLSALAAHESTHRPDAVGGGGKWFGLVQIAPATASGYGCRARSGSALQDGAANLSCAVRILASKVSEQRPVRAIASDWGPFHSAAKREEMRAWVAAQPYCQA